MSSLDNESQNHTAIVAMKEIANFVIKASEIIDTKEVDNFVSLLIDTYNNKAKVLVMGAGRSGLVGKAFAMRLLHMGFSSYVLGETIVPSISKGDLAIAISGSGRTQLIVDAADAAKKVGSKVVALTTFPDSPLGSIADVIVKIPGRSKISKMDDYFARQILGLHEPFAPLGTLFEDTTMIFLDGVVYHLMSRLNISEDQMRNRHANVEF
ncbi:6-phospho 3-hexuloisomerase [Caldisphaera lagunensis DSM 15908]|uniref:6-phospho 3-hexuloisomerase n=1 Tax=Caldisphaera lagunensis (strain DSM 15908 / JCM 11604 / ANMR 0165 / IC-154) TaxID=1056495 RepID=L0AB09_CALLD|nr:6-phospho 3-hexuloisomerase [Caldisphaera lagunensis DSM 15908]